MADNKPSFPTLLTETWANDTNIASGPQVGLSTKLEPASGYKKAGAVPGRSIPGRYMNWVFNNLYAWTYYLGDLHNQTQFLNKTYPWTGTHSFSSAISGNLAVSGYYNYSPSKTGVSIAIPVRSGHAVWDTVGTQPGWAPAAGATDDTMVAKTGAINYYVSLKQALREGMAITKVRAGYNKAGAGTPTMVVRAFGHGVGGNPNTVVDPTNNAALTPLTVGTGTLTSGIFDTGTIGSNNTVTSATDFQISFTSDAAGDELRWIVVDVTLSGLRST